MDIIAWLPFDYVIVEAIWPPCFVSNNARYVSLLKLLRLVRASVISNSSVPDQSVCAFWSDSVRQ